MNIELIALITIALSGSFSHCIFMCGGFVFSYSSVKIDSSWSMAYKSSMHLLYGLGRTSSYVFLGAIFGLIGQLIFLNHTTKGIIFVLLGLFMLVLAISLINGIKKSKYLSFLNSSVDILNTSFMKQIHFKTFKSQTPASFYVFGVLNGLIPCGLVYFFLASAISTGSIIDGMIYMGVFGLCTIPALFILAISNDSLSAKYKSTFNYISSFILMAFGIFTAIKGVLIFAGKMGGAH